MEFFAGIYNMRVLARQDLTRIPKKIIYLPQTVRSVCNMDLVGGLTLSAFMVQKRPA